MMSISTQGQRKGIRALSTIRIQLTDPPLASGVHLAHAWLLDSPMTSNNIFYLWEKTHRTCAWVDMVPQESPKMGCL